MIPKLSAIQLSRGDRGNVIRWGHVERAFEEIFTDAGRHEMDL